jgi:hypothetical protein
MARNIHKQYFLAVGASWSEIVECESFGELKSIRLWDKLELILEQHRRTPILVASYQMVKYGLHLMCIWRRPRYVPTSRQDQWPYDISNARWVWPVGRWDMLHMYKSAKVQRHLNLVKPLHVVCGSRCHVQMIDDIKPRILLGAISRLSVSS